MPAVSPAIEDLSRVLTDPLEKAPIILASSLERASRGPCSLDDIPREGAWLARLHTPKGEVEVLIVDGVIVAAAGGGVAGRSALELIEGECRVELFKVDLDQVPYRDKLLNAAGATSPPRVWIGSTLYSYKVEDVLGEGAFSFILSARGPQGPVALKVLKPEPSTDPGKVHKFRAESLLQAILSGIDDQTIEVVAKLSRGDPVLMQAGRGSVVEVYGLHVPPPQGMDYVSSPPLAVMEIMDGDSSERPDREAPRIAAAAAYALHLAHALGYGHFDLKPQNILYRGARDRIRYKVSDFSGYTRTRNGFLVENITPNYADPLLVARRGVGVGLDSDVYNYYSMLARIATGRPPPCTGVLNGFLIAVHTRSRPLVPEVPGYAKPLLRILSTTFSHGAGPGDLIAEARAAYNDCIEAVALDVSRRMGEEWGEHVRRGLSLDPRERPKSMLDEDSAPWEAIYPARG